MNSKLTCITKNCKQTLNETETPWGVLLSCPSCKGRLVPSGALKKITTQDAAAKLWQDFIKTHHPGSRPCPACTRAMRVVNPHTQSGMIELDVCNSCLLIWFDPNELERIPRPKTSASKPSRPIPDAPSAYDLNSPYSAWHTSSDLVWLVDTILFYWD